MTADLARIKRNVAKMAAQHAPVKDIDGYIASEGVTVDDVKNFRGDTSQPAVPPPPAMSLTDRAADFGQSLATGVRSGIESGIGALGDVADINARGAGWVADKLGASPETVGRVEDTVKFISPGGPLAPTTSQIQGITDPVIGKHYQPKTVAGEYGKTFGEFLPAAALGPSRVATRVATQALIPAITSETAGQLTKGTPYEAPARVLGAVAGPASLSAGRRALTPFPASAERLAQADVLAKEGVDITAGQRTGNKTLRLVEDELGGGAAKSFAERQGKQFTKATLKRAGIDADLATPEVMDQAFDRIGGNFDNLAARNELVPDAKFAADLTADLKGYKELTGSDAKPIIENTITNIVQDLVGTGKLTGERYQEMRSKLDKAARATIVSDSSLSEALRDIRTTLDDAMERSLAAHNPHDAGLWRKVRREYRNILVIEKAASAAGEDARLGIISPKALRAATIQVQRRREFVRGRGDFAKLANAGEAVMSPLGNSNTAGRAAARGLGSGLAGAIMGSGIPGIGTLAGAAAGIVAPTAVGRAILSGPGRAALGNQLATGAGANFGRNAFVSGLMGGRSSLSGGVITGDERRPLEITVNRPNNSLARH